MTVFDNSVLAVAAVSAPEVTKKVAAVILGQFDDLPTEEKDVLFDTFRAWLANKGSVTNAAAQLHVHPNTVRHRLHRIERTPAGRSRCPMNLPKCAWRSRSAKTCPHHRVSAPRGFWRSTTLPTSYRRSKIAAWGPPLNKHHWQRVSSEAAPYKLENKEAMLAVTVTKRPTVTCRSGWMATAPPKVICGRSEK